MISEFSLVTLPKRGNFLRRNRVIAGLGHRTLVIEAVHESGRSITTRLAGEFGRNVFAILGSIHNPLAHGCLQLIRNDAELVDSVNQIVESIVLRLATSDLYQPAQAFGAAIDVGETARDTDATDSAAAPVRAMGHVPGRIDNLVTRTG